MTIAAERGPLFSPILPFSVGGSREALRPPSADIASWVQRVCVCDGWAGAARCSPARRVWPGPGPRYDVTLSGPGRGHCGPRPIVSHIHTRHIPQISDEYAIEPLKATARPGTSSKHLNPTSRRGLGRGPPAYGATERIGSGAPERPWMPRTARPCHSDLRQWGAQDAHLEKLGPCADHRDDHGAMRRRYAPMPPSMRTGLAKNMLIRKTPRLTGKR